MKALQAAVKVKDQFVIELDPRIAKQVRLKDGQLFEQTLTPDGDLLLRRLEENS